MAVMRACVVMAGLLSFALAACGGEDDRDLPVDRSVAAAPGGSLPVNNMAAVDPAPRSIAKGQPVKPRLPSEKPARAAYRAIGAEPFWAVTLRGASAVLERPDQPPLHVAVARTDDAKAIRYLGEGFAMTIGEGPCSDGMSDAIWSDSVQIAFGEGTLKGCGGTRQAP